MRRLTRVCARAYDHEGSLAFVAVISASGFLPLVEAGYAGFAGFTVRPGDHLLHYWLLLVLGASYVVWTVVRLRRRVDPTAAMGFVVAACALTARFHCHFLLFGLGETYGSHSVIEQTATRHSRILIAAHGYGTLLAFALGLALVAWAISRADRAGTSARGSSRSPGTV